ncbi:MAG: hypothetical protein H3C45_04310 [Bacteroidia bacterium]|nr:hypothetical protein [Bacteroidia bacterium]
MRLKKGSKAAKEYMAKIRAKRNKKTKAKKVGSTLFLEKGETTRTKKRKKILVKRNSNGTFKGFKTISGVKKIGAISLSIVGEELTKLEYQIIELKKQIKTTKAAIDKKHLKEVLSVKNNQFKALKKYLNTIAKFK